MVLLKERELSRIERVVGDTRGDKGMETLRSYTGDPGTTGNERLHAMVIPHVGGGGYLPGWFPGD